MSEPKRLTALTLDQVMARILSEPPRASAAAPAPAALLTLPTATEMLEAVQTALKQFGTYSFGDKGPGEVMDIGGFVARLQAHPAEAAAKVLRELSHSGPDSTFCNLYSSAAANAMLMDMQEWDQLFEQPGMDELFSDEIAPLQPGDEPFVTKAAPAKSRRARP